jgi:hypothetical protein
LISNQKDRDATKAARRAHEIHAPSWISNAGHVYLAGQDRSHLRDRVADAANLICAICKKACPKYDGNLEHIRSGRPLVRCDCFGQRLADGTVCTNIQWTHGMFSIHPCHRNKHNREIGGRRGTDVREAI